MPEAAPSGIRDANGLFSEMTTAREWGLTPDQWYQATRAARAMMIATSIMRARVDSEMIADGK
jgi:hypothetical protein